MKIGNGSKAVVLVLATTLWAAWGLTSAPAQLPEPRDVAELTEECGIMAKVLEESMDRSGLESWYPVRGGSSPFASHSSLAAMR